MPWWVWVFAFPAAVLLGILTAVLVAFASGPPWRRRGTGGERAPTWATPDERKAYREAVEVGLDFCRQAPPTLTWDEYDADPHGAMERAKWAPVRVVGDDPSDEMILTWAMADESEGGSD
jgi:hypothetical protein